MGKRGEGGTRKNKEGKSRIKLEYKTCLVLLEVARWGGAEGEVWVVLSSVVRYIFVYFVFSEALEPTENCKFFDIRLNPISAFYKSRSAPYLKNLCILALA